MPDAPRRPDRGTPRDSPPETRDKSNAPPPARYEAGEVTDVPADTPAEVAVAFTPSPVLEEEIAAATCPHCGGVLLPHSPASPWTEGAAHCNACGGCWRDGKLRAGHPPPKDYAGPVEGAP